MTRHLLAVLQRLAWTLGNRTCPRCGCLAFPDENCPACLVAQLRKAP